jgi:stage V sporulation protein D (sporulation-specific penicillin-binding protein)
LVNGGLLLKPYVVSHTADENGKKTVLRETEVWRRVISKEVSDLLKLVLKNTVERGPGVKAEVRGVSLGGKTGTAQKVDAETGKYYKDKYLASFVGFAPFDKPRFVCAIFLDEPRGGVYHGGQVAAPVFSEVIENIINLPEADSQNHERKIAAVDSTIPELKEMDLESAKRILIERDKKYTIAGYGAFVDEVKLKNDTYIITTAEPAVTMKLMPELAGLSVREALRKIDFSRFRVVIQGDGIVKKQSIPPGRRIEAGSTLYLTCN